MEDNEDNLQFCYGKHKKQQYLNNLWMRQIMGLAVFKLLPHHLNGCYIVLTKGKLTIENHD